MSDTDKKGRDGRGALRAWPLLVGLPLILAVAVAGVLLSSGGRPQPAKQPAEEEPSGGGHEGASQGDVELGHPSLGSGDAPVVMIEYGDFQ